MLTQGARWRPSVLGDGSGLEGPGAGGVGPAWKAVRDEHVCVFVSGPPRIVS